MRRRSRSWRQVSEARRSSVLACTSGSESRARGSTGSCGSLRAFARTTSRARQRRSARRPRRPSAPTWRSSGVCASSVSSSSCTAPPEILPLGLEAALEDFPTLRDAVREPPRLLRPRRARRGAGRRSRARAEPRASLVVPGSDRHRRGRSGAHPHRLVDEGDRRSRIPPRSCSSGASPTRPASRSSRSSAGALRPRRRSARRRRVGCRRSPRRSRSRRRRPRSPTPA